MSHRLPLRLLAPLAAACALVAAVPATASAATLPAVSLPAATDGTYALLNDASDVGQTFVAGATGGLDRIVAPIWRSSTAAGDLHVSVWSVGADGLPDASLAATTVANAAVPTAPGPSLEVRFTGAPVLAQGTRYAVVFSAPGTTRHDFPHYVVPFAAGAYDAGERLERNADTASWTLNPGDVALDVVVDDAIVATPPPSSGEEPSTGGEQPPQEPAAGCKVVTPAAASRVAKITICKGRGAVVSKK